MAFISFSISVIGFLFEAAAFVRRDRCCLPAPCCRDGRICWWMLSFIVGCALLLLNLYFFADECDARNGVRYLYCFRDESNQAHDDEAGLVTFSGSGPAAGSWG